MAQQNYAGNRKQVRNIVKAEDRKIVDFAGLSTFKPTHIKITVFHIKGLCNTIGDPTTELSGRRSALFRRSAPTSC